MATNEEILNPKSLVIPIVTPASSLTQAPKGTIVISGAKLYIATAAGVFELITSA